MSATAVAARRSMATIKVLGEGIKTKVEIPGEGATVSDLLKSAGVPVHEGGWDLFVDGARRAADHTLDATRDSAITYAPRTRGA